jgi:hypothetical protein
VSLVDGVTVRSRVPGEPKVVVVWRSSCWWKSPALRKQHGTAVVRRLFVARRWQSSSSGLSVESSLAVVSSAVVEPGGLRRRIVRSSRPGEPAPVLLPNNLLFAAARSRSLVAAAFALPRIALRSAPLLDSPPGVILPLTV